MCEHFIDLWTLWLKVRIVPGLIIQRGVQCVHQLIIIIRLHWLYRGQYRWRSFLLRFWIRHIYHLAWISLYQEVLTAWISWSDWTNWAMLRVVKLLFQVCVLLISTDTYELFPFLLIEMLDEKLEILTLVILDRVIERGRVALHCRDLSPSLRVTRCRNTSLW